MRKIQCKGDFPFLALKMKGTMYQEMWVLPKVTASFQPTENGDLSLVAVTSASIT